LGERCARCMKNAASRQREVVVSNARKSQIQYSVGSLCRLHGSLKVVRLWASSVELMGMHNGSHMPPLVLHTWVALGGFQVVSYRRTSTIGYNKMNA
ncbi:hypothetical protein Dimus_030779, partial [Dionaea muscipula]